MPEQSPVAHLSTARTWRGGEQQALYLAQGLQAHGIDTIVIAQPDSPMSEKAAAAGLTVETVHCRAEYDPVAMLSIARVLKRTKARLLHAHDAHAVTLAAFAARWGGNVPRVCTRRVDFALNSPWKYRWGMDRVICISEAIRGIVRQAGIPEEKLATVRSGIDMARIAEAPADVETVRQEFAGESKKRPILLLNVASLTDHKGQEYLLQTMPEVLAAVPQTYLVIVGQGELEASLKRLANTLALDEHCIFAGFREDVPSLLKACDLFVMSSHLEGLCTSVMDAMAAGKAVVATKAGGLPELVEDGATGLLVPPRDPKALAHALIDLLGDKKKRERFADNAARHARKHFDASAMVDGTLAIYETLWGSHS